MEIYVFRMYIMWGPIIDAWGRKNFVDSEMHPSGETFHSSVEETDSVGVEYAYLDDIIKRINIEINNLQELKDYLIYIKGCLSKNQELGENAKSLNLRK